MYNLCSTYVKECLKLFLEARWHNQKVSLRSPDGCHRDLDRLKGSNETVADTMSSKSDVSDGER